MSGTDCVSSLRPALVASSAAALAKFVLIAWCFFGSSPCFAQDERIVDHFMWKKSSVSGRELAGSQGQSSFNFFDVGDLSHYSQRLVEQDVGRISSAAGLTVDRSSRVSPTLAIVHDSSAFSRLKKDKAAFHSLGLPDSLLATLESQISETSTCATLTLIDDKGDIRVAVVLLSEKFNVCLLDGLLNSFGINPTDITAADIDDQALQEACILYEGRRIGLRDRESLIHEMSKLRSLCLAKEEARRAD